MKNWLILSLLFLYQLLLAQSSYTTKNQKAIKYYEAGIQKYTLIDYEGAEEMLLNAARTDTNFVEPFLVLGDLMYDQKKYLESIKYYKAGLGKSEMVNPDAYVSMVDALISIGNYEEALQYSQYYLGMKPQNIKAVQRMQLFYRNCAFAVEAVKKPVPFNPMNLGANINSELDEYWPSISADEQTLVFTILKPIDKSKPVSSRNRQEDFHFSFYTNGSWEKALDMGRPINTQANEGAQTIFIDGKTMYFTACGRPDGIGKCDLYISRMEDGYWSVPQNLGRPVNSPAKETQPSISSDEMELYFISDRAGGFGGLDIWCSKKGKDGRWGEPYNLGDSINTSANEQSPFIHHDNSTLYFSSDGHAGMGGYDLYVARRKIDKSWSAPINLGYPINTFSDEVGLNINARGNKAYFSSDRIKEKGKDIFVFDLPEEVRPSVVSYMKGKVYDAQTLKPIKARFELIDLYSEETINQSTANSSGEFLVCIPTNRDYVLNASAKGYLFYSGGFSLQGVNDNIKPYLVDVPLQPIKTGEKMILRNIFFDSNSFELKNTSKAELNKLMQFLKDNKKLKIEIGGHTDNIGNLQYNMKLSENRAKSVMVYLVSSGIEAARLKYKGYGPTQPIADNTSEEGKSLNRRTEIKIIE